jgi:hypothetical protein
MIVVFDRYRFNQNPAVVRHLNVDADISAVSTSPVSIFSVRKQLQGFGLIEIRFGSVHGK